MVAEETAVALMEIHASTRGNVTVLGKKLAPLKYSKDLERLAKKWVKTCKQSQPTNPRFASLRSSVVVAPAFESVVHKWRGLVSSEGQNFNPATGECTAAPCEHFMQVVQPNNTYFGCAVRDCVLWLSANLSVCLYQAGGFGAPTEQEIAPSDATITTASTTAVKITPVKVKSGARPELFSSALTNLMDYFVEEKEKTMESFEEEEEELKEDGGKRKKEEEEDDEESVMTVLLKSTTTTRLGSLLLDIVEFEGEEDDEVKKSSISAKLPPLLHSFAVTAVALLL